MPELRTGYIAPDLKDTFRRTCKLLNGKSESVVLRDLADTFVKAVRKAQAWPSCLESPIYKDVIDAAVDITLKGTKIHKPPFQQGDLN